MDWVTVSMPLGGLDAQTDPVHVLPGRLLRVENARLDQPGGLSKRFGYDLRSTTTLHTTPTISSGRRLAEGPTGEQFLVTERNLFSWYPSKGVWIDRGYLPDVKVEREHVYGSAEGGVSDVEIAASNSVEAVTWASVGSEIGYQVRRGGVVLTKPTAALASTSLVHLFAIGSFIYSVRLNVTTVEFSRIDTTTSTAAGLTFPTHAALPGPVTSDGMLCVSPVEGTVNRWLLMYRANGGGNIFIELWDTNATPVLQWSTDLGETADGGTMCIATNADGHAWAAWADTTNGVRMTTVNLSTGTAATPIGVLGTATDAIRLTIARLDSTNAVIVWERKKEAASPPPSEKLPYIQWRRVNTTPSVQGNQREMGDVALAARAYVYGTSVYVPVIHGGDGYGYGYLLEIAETSTPSELPPHWAATFELEGAQAELDETNEIITNREGQICPVAQTGAQVEFLVRTRTRLRYAAINDDDIIRAHQGVAKIRLTHDAASRNFAHWGSCVFWPSGRPSWWDGAGLAEHGFAWPPSVDRDGPGDMTTNPSGSIADTITAQAVLVWTFQDAAGMLHWSEPSRVMEFTTPTTGGNNHVFRIRFVNTLLTDRGIDHQAPQSTAHYWHDGTGKVKALGFRTLDGPGPRFLRGMAIAGANVPAYTYTAATNIDLGLAGFDDASIATNDVIYTDGEILPNTTTPPCDISVVHQGRLWLAGLSNPKELAWSQPYVETEAVRFTADFRTLVDDDIIGLASQDEKLLIFSGRSIRELIGDGPPASGDVDTGFRIRRVNTDVGCTGHRTIVPSPLGTFFHSSRGFQLLTRGMSVEYVGAAVEQKLKTQSITPIAGCLVPDQHHVRWLCVDGEGKRWIYVFDYKVQEWIIDLPGATIFTAGTDLFTFGAGAAGSEHCIVDTDGLVYFEDPDQGFDYEDFFSFVIETPWFHLNQCLQGWQRVRRVQLLGRNALVDPPDLVVEARWDYETAWTTLGTATPTELLAVAGAAGREFQVEFRIPDGKQRCEAIQLRVFDQANVDGGSGLGFRLSEICFQAGIKRGPKRLPETARAA